MSKWFMTVDEFIHEHLEVNEYINYCEAIINKEGLIGYAIPSHNYALQMLYGYTLEEVYDIDKCKDLWDKIPSSASPNSWMCEDLGVCSVWFSKLVIPKNYTEEQLKTIAKLMSKGIVSENAYVEVAVEKTHYEIEINEDFDKLREERKELTNNACIRIYVYIKELLEEEEK